MPYMHKWFIEKQVLSARLWGTQTIEELIESNEVITGLLNQSDGRLIHIIMDDGDLLELPASLFEIRKVLTYTTHKSLGWVVVYGIKERTLASSIKDFIFTTLAKLSRARYLRVKTFEDAITHLKSVDSSLDWTLATDEVMTKDTKFHR